jgi:RNA-binding protein
MSLDGKGRRALRALGHHLRPVVQIGQAGITGALVEATGDALAAHELIKVKVLESAPLDRRQAARDLAAETRSEVAQILGRTILLFRRNPESPKVALPGEPPPAARHASIGGEGDRPAAKARKGSSTQGAGPARKAAPVRKAAPARKPPRAQERTGTGARLPPRRHGR